MLVIHFLNYPTRWFNLGEYLNPDMYGNRNHGGYPSSNQETFFYNVAVNLYGVSFNYQGEHYSIPSDGEEWVLRDEANNIISGCFPNPIALIENSEIKGHNLIDIIDDLKDVNIE